MKIKRLTIDSVRGIQSLELDLSSTQVNVLLGVNGVGKSTVLKCMIVLLSALGHQLNADTPDKSPAVLLSSRFSHKEENLVPGAFDFSDINNARQSLQVGLEVDIDGEFFQWGILAERSIRAGYRLKTARVPSVEIVPLTSVVSFLNKTDKNSTVLLFYPVNRGFQDVELDSVAQDVREYDADSLMLRVYEPKDLRARIIDFSDFFNWFRTIEDLENEERRDNSEYRNHQLKAVRSAIRVIEPEFSSLRVRRSPLRMTITKDGQEIILDNLSDGEKCLMAMVGDIARRLAIANPDHPNPLEGEGIVLIDEIELHLHPQWQRGILPKLSQTFPNCQFIVTTHSPQVVSDVPAESIFVLEKDAEGNVTAHHPDSSFGRDTNSILEDVMGVPDRPLDIKNKLRQLFRHIDDGNLDDARQLRQSLADQIGGDEPEFAKADVLIRRKEILGR